MSIINLSLTDCNLTNQVSLPNYYNTSGNLHSVIKNLVYDRANRIQEFVNELEGTFLKTSHDHFSSLAILFKNPAQVPQETMKKHCTKESSYLRRLFSRESWEEWSEHRTDLGKVMALFNDFETSKTRAKNYIKRLTYRTLQKADDEARALLKELQKTKPMSPDELLPVSQLNCATGLIFGAIGSIRVQNPLFLCMASLQCLSLSRAFFQNHIILAPGKSFYAEGDRKVAVCKGGKVAWNDHDTCGYHGPAMEVTIICTKYGQQTVLFSGPLYFSHQWFCHNGRISIQVENTNNEESAMYVHIEH